MNKVRYGIIGVGNMGSKHLDSFVGGSVANAEVVAIADLKESKLKVQKDKYPHAHFTCYANGAELIEKADVDAVIIAVPHYDHPVHAIQALNKGLHVICEKPAGVYTKQVKEMNEVAKNSKALFTMMFNQRTNCLYRKMRELILEGAIGSIKRINWLMTDWYRPQSYYDSGDWRATWDGEGGGVLFNQSPHQLDLISWVTGMMPKRVHAFCHFGKWHNIEVEDDVTAYLEYDNGGKLVCENDELILYKNKIDERKFNETYKGGFGQPEFEVINVETDGKNPQHLGILRNFTNAILGTEALFVDGVEGLNGVVLMDAMLLSTWLNKGIDLPFDDELYLEELNKRRKASKKKDVSDIVLNTEGTY
jgi:predicted dehydrogenase